MIATPKIIGHARPRLEYPPARPLWLPRPIGLLGQNLSVRYETAICDKRGRIERVLQRGSNTISNWGMDQLGSQSVCALVDYLVLSSTQDARKRVMSGPVLTVTYTSPTNIAVASDVSFFVAGDAGRTLKLPNIPELKITTYTNSQNVTCQTPSGDWLPGFVPPGAPTNYGTATIFYTELSTLATYFTQFNSYDSGGQTQTTDNTNSRFIHERIFLSATVTGSDWTVNQLGWSDGNGSHNCFGLANLASPDVIAVGKKYRVKLDVYSVYTPINLAGVAVNWGGTIGNYTMDIRQEFIGLDYTSVNNPTSSFLEPHSNHYYFSGSQNWQSGGWTTAHILVPTYWQGQSGGTAPAGVDFYSLNPGVTLGAYTNGQFKRTKNVKWPDTVAINNATALAVTTNAYPLLTLRPQSGTVTKPSGYWCDATFKVYWTRDLPT